MSKAKQLLEKNGKVNEGISFSVKVTGEYDEVSVVVNFADGKIPQKLRKALDDGFAPSGIITINDWEDA